MLRYIPHEKCNKKNWNFDGLILPFAYTIGPTIWTKVDLNLLKIFAVTICEIVEVKMLMILIQIYG